MNVRAHHTYQYNETCGSALWNSRHLLCVWRGAHCAECTLAPPLYTQGHHQGMSRHARTWRLGEYRPVMCCCIGPATRWSQIRANLQVGMNVCDTYTVLSSGLCFWLAWCRKIARSAQLTTVHGGSCAQPHHVIMPNCTNLHSHSSVHIVSTPLTDIPALFVEYTHCSGVKQRSVGYSGGDLTARAPAQVWSM